MAILFPIAGVHLNVFLVSGLAGLVGFLSSSCGVAGSFLLVPLLIMAGVPPEVGAASDVNHVVAASAAGSMAHGRAGNVDWELGLFLVAGGLSGGLAGTGLVHYLAAAGSLAYVVKLGYVVMLPAFGGYALWGGGAKRLPGRRVFRPRWLLVAVGFLVGVLAALTGVGGGFIMLPVLIFLFGVPAATAVGTTLVVVFFTAAEVTLAQSMLNHTVDTMLALVLLAGSSTGARLGAGFGRRWRGGRAVFALAVLGTMGMMLYGLGHELARTGAGAVIPGQGCWYGVMAVLTAAVAGLAINGLLGGATAVRELWRRQQVRCKTGESAARGGVWTGGQRSGAE